MTKIEIDLFLHLNCTEISREIFASARSLNITQYFEIHCIYLFVQLILKQDQLSKRTTCLKLCIDVSLSILTDRHTLLYILIALCSEDGSDGCTVCLYGSQCGAHTMNRSPCTVEIRLLTFASLSPSLPTQLLDELYKLKNWQSFKSVLIALHCIPIIRLKQTWTKLHAIYPNAYEEFQRLSRFNLINHDHHLLHNHNQPSIPCLSEFLNEIRARIAFKLNQVNYKPKLFAKPETLTDWLTCEVRNLENLLLMNQQLSPTDDKAADKDKIKKSNIIKKLLKSFNSKKKKIKQQQKQRELEANNQLNASGNHLQLNASSNHLQPNGQTQLRSNANSTNNLSSSHSLVKDHSIDYAQLKANLQLDDKDRVDDELILMKTVNSNNCLEEWKEIQMDLKIKLSKLRPEMENSILNEINKCLELHKSFVLNYRISNEQFSNSIQHQEANADEPPKASIIRRCLLQLVKLNSNSMQELMKISLALEPHEEEPPTN